MKHLKKKKRFIQAFLLLIILPVMVFSQNRSIQFEKGTWEEIVKKAEQKNKLIFIEVYAPWSGHCKYIERNVFINDTVADFYNENFICVRINMESDEGKVIMEDYDISVPPYLLFVDKKTKVIHRAMGSEKTRNREFIETGLTALNPYQNFMYYKNTYELNCCSSEFIFKYLDMMESLYLDTKEVLTKYFNAQNESDFISENNWRIIQNCIHDIDSEVFLYLLNNKNEFIKHYSVNEVNDKIYNTFLDACYDLIYSKDFDVNKYEALKNQIKSTEYYNSDKVIFVSDLKYYKKIKDWNSFSKIALVNVDKYFRDYTDALNNIAWDFYLYVDDKKSLEKAKEWAKRSVDLQSNCHNYDTYAALLFKLNKESEAIRYEKKALQFAREKGKPTKHYEEMLEKMQKAKQENK